MKKLLGLAALAVSCSSWLSAAEPLDLTNHAWPAHWIAPPGVSLQDYGVYHFRKSFNVSAPPTRFVVHVTGDNRYQLFINGLRVAWGPARGDLTHWRYETVDVAPYLHAGKNALAAVVWNDGAYKAVAQVTNETGFLLQADSPDNADVNTGRSWKCFVDKAYSPVPIPRDQVTGYHALAANERVDGSLYPWGWEETDYDDSHWVPAAQASSGSPRDARDGPNRWMLVPRPIPPMEERPQMFRRLRRVEGIELKDPYANVAAIGEPKLRFTVPPKTKVRLLLDQQELTTAFPQLEVNGGKGATIQLRYAESLYKSKNPIDKGNRNDIDGKTFYGYEDWFLPDGGASRRYAPLFWRTYRYVEMNIQTADEPLTVADFYGIYTGYPFNDQARFVVDDAGAGGDIQQILNTGFHTARLCAHETYMDCPYYEQLQYAGDARIQMMVSLYMTGDARLMKNGIALLNSSRTAEGATLSRAPSFLQQYIPPFSLWWIGMVHDYWMYVDDEAFVREMLPGVRAVLSFYSSHQKTNGSLGHMPWWNFVDWVNSWRDGEPPAEADGSSAAAIDLQLLLAYQWAADLEEKLDSPALAAEYRHAAEHLRATIAETDWDASRGLFADQPSHRTFSQQVNALAVISGVAGKERARTVIEKTLADPSLAPASIYFRAYLNAALRDAGLGNRYLDQLKPWRDMLAEGLTTWAEWSGPDARSDCHAWGASPNIEVFRTVAGIESTAPAFSKVRVAPNPGPYNRFHGSIPHPRGKIEFTFERAGSGIKATIDLPDRTSGEFVWQGKTKDLHAGSNRVEM